MSGFILLFFLKRDSSNVHIKTIFVVVAVSSVVSLQEDSVEVPGLHVFVFTAPAGSSLQVDHDLLQLLLYHVDAGSYCEEDDQTAKCSYYCLE